MKGSFVVGDYVVLVYNLYLKYFVSVFNQQDMLTTNGVIVGRL